MILKVIASFVILRIIIAQGDEATDDRNIRKASSSYELNAGKLEKDLISLAENTEAGPVSDDGSLNIEEDVGSNIEMTDDKFYDYYGLDYGDEDNDEGIGDLLSDLDPDPELLQTISPTLIGWFFESASPENLKAILDEVLLKLPPETISLIVQK